MKSKRKILIVDDDIQVVEHLKEGLEKHGYEVIIGKNGREAIELTLKYYPDLILMDIMMPEMNGLDACKVIKSHGKSDFIPIIFLTGRTSLDDRMKGLDTGADDYLIKPFGMKELIARVRSMLRIKRLTERLKEVQHELIEAKQVAAIAATAVTVNHKINNPLTTIILNTQIISKKLPESVRPLCRPYLDMILDDAKTIGKLTQKLTKVSKPNFIDYLPGTSMIDVDFEE